MARTFAEFVEIAEAFAGSGTVGGDSGFQQRQMAGLYKGLDRTADAAVGVAKGGAKAVGAAAKGVAGALKSRPKTKTTVTTVDTVKTPDKTTQITKVDGKPVKKVTSTTERTPIKTTTKPKQEVKKPEVKKPEVKKPESNKITKKDNPKQQVKEGTYDAEVMGRSQIRKTGEGGRIGAERKKTTPERRRMKAVGGGKQEPVDYKPRKDIGQQRQASTRVQQPTQERGSAAERQAAAAKEERRKAAQARIAAKKAGGDAPAAKPKAKEVEKQATKLLSTKKPEKKVSPDYEPAKASGMTRAERMKITRAGETKLRGIMKQQETEKYKKATGQAPTGKAKSKVLAMVAKRMAN